MNYFFFDLVESKGYMPLCQTTDLLAKAMYRRLGAICQNRKSLIMKVKYKYFHSIIIKKCRRRNPTPKIVFSFLQFIAKYEKGVREPV
jgi:hypothetical protein